jgi:hypothetical protein
MTAEKRTGATGMVTARRRDSDRKQSATASTINRFLLDGTLISVSAVAQAAGVSRNFIYSHDGLVHQLEAARHSQADLGDVPGQRQPSQGAPGRAALVTELAIANQTIRRLRRDLADLQSRHEYCLGEQLHRQEADKARESISADGRRVHLLTEENRSLKQRIEVLSLQVNDLIDDLTAERRAGMGSLSPCPDRDG